MAALAFLLRPEQLRYSSEIAVALLVVVLGGPLFYGLHVLSLKWQRALRARRIFEAQGVKCLPRPFFYGNLPEFAAINAKARAQPMPEMCHAVAPRLLAHLYEWSKTYGEHFVYWYGFQPRYIIREPDQGKELLLTKSGHFTKPATRPDAKELGGVGFVALHGEKWAQHRRILNPAFYIDRLKAMAPIMVQLTAEMMETWEARVARKEPIDVVIDFQNLTADIIAHTAFGTSFAEGKLVFEIQHKQQELIARLNSSIYIPGSRFLPTAQNRYGKSLRNKIHEVVGQIIKNRMQMAESGHEGSFGNDLLGLMLAANKRELQGNQKNLTMGLDELIDECKNFFFAGHETTATLLSFMFLLLSEHPEWQERLRGEVFEVCGSAQLPTAESLNYLKLVGMVINETLRLYPPAIASFRQTDADIKVGKILVPAGTVIIVPILAWHHDERFWGADAKEFRPQRFEEGVSKACKVPGAFLPFSFGPRICIGHLFSTIEAKMILATILQQYRFRLSPEYVHAPTVAITMRAQFGMPILFEKLKS